MASPRLRAFRERLLYRLLVIVSAIGRRIPLRVGQFLGRALGRRRSSVIIATKFGQPMPDGGRGARPDYIRRACDVSLKRLGTDYIDLYQQHVPDPDVPIEETLGALDELVQSGVVKEIAAPTSR